MIYRILYTVYGISIVQKFNGFFQGKENESSDETEKEKTEDKPEEKKEEKTEDKTEEVKETKTEDSKPEDKTEEAPKSDEPAKETSEEAAETEKTAEVEKVEEVTKSEESIEKGKNFSSSVLKTSSYVEKLIIISSEATTEEKVEKEKTGKTEEVVKVEVKIFTKPNPKISSYQFSSAENSFGNFR